ncbi:nitrate- and nitrite sensing domain-containing protein [Pseudonocardia sp. WMMC193]|uniref:sensor histidine kinase n=1 Tax=Pseudonocardia sp. WMMC193 TaxID=2911965 RepID=UPI001F398182|nr:nitrate- and nitrite sensing domain-containing protein [Pseudonocardia sp. WMMC193]MCF7552820.1 nitrate- and nitrite sensing domain-containing protein [Pseudonocardia sp. WMMC193]
MTSTERDPAWSERLNPRNWSLAAKLVAVGLVPTVLALVLGVLRISDQAGVAAQLGEDNRLLDIRAGVSETSQLLQAERNAAVLFVAGGRQGDRGALDQAVAASDASLDRVRSAIAAPDLLDASSTTALQNAEGGFTQLPVLRSEAGNSLVSTDDVRSRYTSIIERAGVLERALIRQAATADGAGLGDALTATSEAREALALQHTTLAGAIVAGELREPDRIVVTGTDAAFTSAFADYQVALTPDQLGDYGNFATDAANVERERLKTAIMATPAGRPVTADLAAWDTAYANSVAVVDRAAQGVGGELDATSIAAQENAGNQAGVNSVILMLGVLLGIAIIVLLARSLIRSLRILRRSALDVAERKLPAAVESMRSGQPLNAMVEPVPLTGRDEVGQVARAFDAVHGQAIRLAADQAALQSNVSNMFVNLSRRSQALVERQLQLIEQLESNEQDPDQLSNLFQLDHLATRMRRNSENLLVLAGTDLTKRNVAPVPVVDVLRAAVSEIEQYQRVVVQPPPVATVAGRAASDLVHLLAELLDNATNFSPPDSQVVMSTTRANDGSLFVEIADRGVGMADHELSEANQRLSQPAAVDVSASRRMGLFVVGRLANRHGLGVRLGGGVSGGTGGGLTASVAVPANLVPTAEPVDRRPARAGATAGVAPAVAFGGAPALPASAPSAPSGSPSLPEQRPSTGNGRSLSSLVAGDDGPMSPAPAFGAGRPPTPPVNGNGAPGRRPAPVPPEEGDEAAQAPRPAGPERGPWPVESLRRPPTGDPAPPTNGTPTAVPSAFTGPAELPKRTPRGVNGTPRGAETAESAKSEGPAPTGRAAGLAAGAAGLAGASALPRGMDEGARTPETSDTADATADPETAAAAEFDSGEGEHTTRFPSELPRREATPRGARGGEGASALDEGTSPRETGGLPTRRPGSPADAGSATGSTTGATAFGTGAAGTGASETADAAEDGTPPVGAPAAAVESTGAQARPGRPRSAERSEKDTDGAEAGTDPSTVDSADTDSGRAHDLLEGGRDASGSDSSESTDSALDSARPGPDTDSTRAGDSTRAAGAGALGAAALGAAALGGAAPGRGERTDPTDTERADTERPGSERVDSERPAAERPAAEQPAAERSDTERPAAEQPGTGFPQRRPLSPGRPADRRPALGSPGGLLPGRGAEEPSPGRLSGPPAPRENPPIGPAGLPQRTPRRPRQAPTGGTDGLFAASTPGDTQTTGQLRRPGGFESRRPSRATDPVPGTAAEAFGAGSTDTGATTSTPSSTAPGPARNGAGSRGDESRGGDDRIDTTTGSTGSDSAAGARAESTGTEHAVDRRPGTDRPEPAQGESGRPESGRPDTSRPDPSRPETGAAGLPLRTPGANRGVRPYGTSPTGESAPTGRSSTAPGPGDTGPTGTERNGQPASAPNGTGPNGTGPNGTGPNGTGQNGQGGPVRLGEGPRPTDDGRRRPTPFSAPAPFAGGAFGGPAGRPPQAPRPNGPAPYGPTPHGNGHAGNGAAARPGPAGPAGPPQRPARPQPPADDAGLPGSTGAGPAPSRPSGFDLGQTTPIFEEIASAWFRSNGDVPVRWAEDGSAAPEEPAQPPVFATAADEGWRVADATAQATAAESDKQAETTDAGLPKRRPRARLVPGNAAGSAVLAPPSGPARNAEAIRGRLASYQQGVRQGRESRLRSRSAPGPNEQQNEENR